MASATTRRFLWALAIVALLLVGAAFSLPWIASTQILRDRIALELSAWSGYRVKLGAAPEIDLWPVFRTTLSGVEMSSWSGSPDKPVIDAEVIQADLSPLAALRGNIVFTNVRLVRPTLRLAHDEGGDSLRLAQTSGAGRIVGAIGVARTLLAANPTDPDRSKLPATPMGTVSFRDARVVVEGADGTQELMSSVNGNLGWPALNRAATLSATGIWRGESVALEASSNQPLLLLAGGLAPLSLSLKSAPATVSFAGNINLAPNSFVDGDVSFSTPSLKRLLEWSNAGIGPGAAIGGFSIDSHVNGNAQRLKFENAKLVLDTNPGNGTLEVSLPQGDGGVPGVSGTLAFDKMDLVSVLAAFSTLGIHTGPSGTGMDASLADQLNLDLRISAANATAGSIALTNVAATAQVKQGLAAFDISDAKVFGGTAQTGLRMDGGADGATSVEFRVLADNIDSAAFATAMNLKRLAPAARGDVSVILKGVGQNWKDVLETANGSVTASFGPGSLPGLNLAHFLERASKGSFFALSDVADGALPFKSLDLSARLENGVAHIEKADIVTTASQRISLGGIVPSLGRGLALSGTVKPVGTATDAVPTSVFFVGGSWETPFVSPIGPNWPMQ